MNNKWKSSVLNVEPYSSFTSIDSDHRIVTARIRLSLRAPKQLPPKKRYDWKLLRYDSQLCKGFEIELRNRYSDLFTDGSATEQFDALIKIKAKDNIAEKLLPLVPKDEIHRHSNNPAVIKARKKVKDLTHRYSVNKSKAIRKQLQLAKDQLAQEYKLIEQDQLAKMIEEAEILRKQYCQSLESGKHDNE